MQGFIDTRLELWAPYSLLPVPQEVLQPFILWVSGALQWTHWSRGYVGTPRGEQARTGLGQWGRGVLRTIERLESLVESFTGAPTSQGAFSFDKRVLWYS